LRKFLKNFNENFNDFKIKKIRIFDSIFNEFFKNFKKKHFKTFLMKKAIILLSGGLDSATTASIAKKQGFELYGLSFFYGQRHKIELESAQKIADFFDFKEHKIANIDLRIFGGSALTAEIAVPKNSLNFSSNSSQNLSTQTSQGQKNQIPITYVPARNTIFLSYALAFAEVVESFDIFIGVNAVDYSGYPDCRAEFIEAFAKMANLATASSLKNKGAMTIHTPLINLKKSQIIQTGIELGVDYSITHSCYDPQIIDNITHSCGTCDSCLIRLAGFKEIGIIDKINYLKK
jgi:7-cyano-7-deazaguanine synthase